MEEPRANRLEALSELLAQLFRQLAEVEDHVRGAGDEVGIGFLDQHPQAIPIGREQGEAAIDRIADPPGPGTDAEERGEGIMNRYFHD